MWVVDARFDLDRPRGGEGLLPPDNGRGCCSTRRGHSVGRHPSRICPKLAEPQTLGFRTRRNGIKPRNGGSGSRWCGGSRARHKGRGHIGLPRAPAVSSEGRLSCRDFDARRFACDPRLVGVVSPRKFGFSVVASLAVALVLAAAALGQAPGGADHAFPAAVGEHCRLTKITGTTDNRTGMPLTVVAVRHGARDTWCRAAAGKVPARSSATIGMAGSNSSGASLDITYRLQNGDEIRFQAGLRFPLSRGNASCSLVRVVRSPRRYECKAELTVHALTKHAVAVFTVAEAPKSPVVGSPQFCGSASAIDGFTLNKTSLLITLWALGKGATNAWCQLDTDPVPAHSQNVWKVGDTFFGTSVDLTYSVATPNHTPDFFEFNAHVNFGGGGGGASCAPIEYFTGQPNSGTFKC